MKDNTSNKSVLFCLFLLLIISIIIKISYIDKHSLWLDEAYTVWFTRRSWYELWFWVPKFESHPPFYYSLMKIWGLLFGDINGNSFRYASVVLSWGIFFIGYKILNNFISIFSLERSTTLLLSSFLFLFCPVIVWYSIEARPYILLSLCFSIAIYAATIILLKDTAENYTIWFVFIIGITLTNWSHNLGPLYSASIFIVLFFHALYKFKEQKKNMIMFSFSVVCVIIMCFPLLIMIINQLTQWAASSWIHEPTFNSLRWTLQDLFGFKYLAIHHKKVFGTSFLFKFIYRSYALTPIILAGYGAFKLAKKGHILLAAIFCFPAAVIPLITFIISILGPNIFLYRTLIPVLIPYYIFLGISIGFIRNRYLSTALILIMALTVSIGLYDKLRWGKKEPWQEITNILINDYDQNGTVLLLPNSIRIPIEIYDSNHLLSATLHSLPAEYPAIKFSSFYPAGTPAVPGITNDDIPVLKKYLLGKQTIYLLVRGEKLFDPDNIVQKVIKENFILFNTIEWGGIKLYQFKHL